MKSKIQPFSRAVALAIAALAGAAGLNAQTQTLQLREARPVAVTGDLVDMASANDGNEKTRAYAGKADYPGLSVTLDMGGDQNIVGVIQDHGPWSNDYPGTYRVDVGLTPNGPWLKAFEGPGKRGESRSIFDAVRGRYIRITATGTHGLGKDWTLAEFRVGVDPGAKPRVI
ncbi:MAG TPA: discoidin domain-containing protein, partial [Blastocatellia bacterium]|nr:discoidin domain-containing protein [Blastocatellia bacterium]